MMRALKIAKFGGTSVASFESLLHCANIVKNDKAIKIVVVSAQAGITEKLIALTQANSLEHLHATIHSIILFYDNFTLPMYGLPLQTACQNIISDWVSSLNSIALQYFYTKSQDDYQTVIAMGEIISSQLTSVIFDSCLLKNNQVSALELVYVKGDTYDNHEFVLPACREACNNWLAKLEPGQLIVTQGFIAKHIETAKLITLGRGGSDLSAAILAEACDAKELQIWTDVAGVYSGDPRLLPASHAIRELSYHTTALLANLGAKVLHRRSIEPAMRGNIPIIVASTFRPNSGYTLIHDMVETSGPCSVTYLKDVTVLKIKQNALNGVTLTHILMDILTQLASCVYTCELHADTITLVTPQIEQTTYTKLKQYLVTHGFNDIVIESQRHLTLVSIVGHKLQQTDQFYEQIGEITGLFPINKVIGVGHESALSFVIEPVYLSQLLTFLHQLVVEHQGNSAQQIVN
ncbi:aspartate kinase [Pseudoalteromonas fenneropenaei]|uniref:Aspartokinase n=1 Tax=Pseudoalteromonas fenneropenaei TaxID=1737459 RepID=A0ABV7CP67_9GAMM